MQCNPLHPCLYVLSIQRPAAWDGRSSPVTVRYGTVQPLMYVSFILSLKRNLRVRQYIIMYDGGVTWADTV